LWLQVTLTIYRINLEIHFIIFKFVKSMKKSKLFLACLLFSLPLYSQNRVGLMGGYTSTNFSIVPDVQKSESIEGSMVGFMYEKQLSEFSFIHSSTMFVTKGAYLRGAKLKLSYVEQTAMLKVGDNIFAQAGLTLGYLISARGIISQGSGDLTEKFPKLDFGFVAGIGFRLGPLVIEGRYAPGLINILPQGEPVEAFNIGIYLLAGISIPIGSARY
jgi:hypothetical protein